jgi:hypothetical protein
MVAAMRRACFPLFGGIAFGIYCLPDSIARKKGGPGGDGIRRGPSIAKAARGIASWGCPGYLSGTDKLHAAVRRGVHFPPFPLKSQNARGSNEFQAGSGAWQILLKIGG